MRGLAGQQWPQAAYAWTCACAWGGQRWPLTASAGQWWPRAVWTHLWAGTSETDFCWTA